MAYIGTIQDGSGTTVYPQTKKDGILDWPTDLANKSDITKVYETEITVKNGQVIQFKRLGNVVIANFDGTASTRVETWTNIGTVPPGFSVAYEQIIVGVAHPSDSTTIIVSFGTDGVILNRDKIMPASGEVLGEAVWFTKDDVPS